MSYENFVGQVLKDCWRKLLVKCWSTSVVFHNKWSKECLFEWMLCYWSSKGVLTCCLSVYLFFFFFFWTVLYICFSFWFFASPWVCFTINDFKMFHSSERWGWYKKYFKKVQALCIMSIDRMWFHLISKFLVSTMDDVEILFTRNKQSSEDTDVGSTEKPPILKLAYFSWNQNNLYVFELIFT